MARKSKGIAGIPGNNLNSVRDALRVSGLYPVHLANGSGQNDVYPQNFSSRLAQIRASLDPYFKTSSRLDKERLLKSRELLSQLPGMEPMDYAALKKEDQEQNRLNFFLKMAQHGFTAAALPPSPGESPLSTLSRGLAAPLAADVGEIASEAYKTKRAYTQLEKEEKRALSQAALTYEQTQAASEAASEAKRTEMAFALMEEDTTPVGIKENLQELVDGKWVPFVGFSSAWKYGEVPQYNKIVDGKKVLVDSDKIRVSPSTTTSEGKGLTQPGFKPVTFEVPIFGVNDEGNRVITGIGTQHGEVWTYIDKGGEGGPEMVVDTTKIYRPGTLGTEVYTNAAGDHLALGRDVFGMDVANWEQGESQDMWLRTDLSEEEIKKLRRIRGFETLPLGQRVFRQRDKYKTDTSHTRDRLYISTSGQLIGSVETAADQALIEELFTSEKPKDVIPAGGQRISDAATELTFVKASDGSRHQVNAVLFKESDGSVSWHTVALGEEPSARITQEWLSKRGYEKGAWGSESRDSLYSYNKVPANEAFKNHAKNLTQAREDIRTKIAGQNLTRAEVLAWSNFEDTASKEQYLRDIVVKRASDLKEKSLESDVARDSAQFFGAAFTQDKSVITVATPLTDTGRGVYINATEVDPYDREADKNIQIGRWSAPRLNSETVELMRRNASSIGEGFQAIMARDMGFEDEQILTHSQLWKHLPGIGEAVQQETFSPNKFREMFNVAKAKYEEAKAGYTPAVDIAIGSSNLATKIRTGLDATDDVQTMLNHRDVAGAWFSDGTWLAEMRGGALGELWETYVDPNGNETAMPSERWLAIANPKNEADKRLRDETLQYFQGGSNNKRTDKEMSLDEFERAAVFLGAMNRSMTRVFELIDETRPSDRDVEIMLNGLFVQGDLSETRNLDLLLNLGKKYSDLIINSMNSHQHTAIYDPDILFRLGQVGRAFTREAIPGRTGGPADKGRRAVQAAYKKWGRGFTDASNRASERIIPGRQGLGMSPITGTINSDIYRQIERTIRNEAQDMFPQMTSQEAFDKFIQDGFYVKNFRSMLEVSSEVSVFPSATQIGPNSFRLDN